MKRDLKALSSDSYDVLIIGGGIYGACLAWEAVLRGLSVALLEKRDFGSATSSNRYPAHKRALVNSVREWRLLLREKAQFVTVKGIIS